MIVNGPVTATRIVVAGATTALVRRTTLRKAFLGPWHPLVNDIWLYALADAQRETGVAVHLTSLVPSHQHTDVTPSRDNLPEFTRRLHRDTSCALHDLLCRERYDAPRELFDDRQTHAMRLLDAAAQASHLIYEYLNPVAAGLVRRPEHMPGRTIGFGLWKTGFIEVDRPPVYFDSRRPERLRLELTPPPLLYQAFDGDLDRLVHHMHRLAEDGMRALRDARRRPVMGAKELRRLHPWSEPRTLRQAGTGRVPTFRLGARGILGQLDRIEAAGEVHHFRGTHEEARIARRDGDFLRRFPFGTYGARVYRGAPVEPEPPEGALVASPGPLLRDVKAELAEREHDRTALRAASEALLDVVRAALVEEATEIVEATEIDLAKPEARRVASSTGSDSDADQGAKGRGQEATAGSEERAPAVVRHRFDKKRSDDLDEAPARLVILRDRRRGRPPGSGPKHGADPPG